MFHVYSCSRALKNHDVLYEFCANAKKYLHQADKNDVILVAGKGHEAYQQIGTVKRIFSDQDIVQKFIESKQ